MTKKENETIIKNLIEQINTRLGLIDTWKGDKNKLSLHHENNFPTIDFGNGHTRFYQTNTNKEMIAYLKGFINGLRFVATHNGTILSKEVIKLNG